MLPRVLPVLAATWLAVALAVAGPVARVQACSCVALAPGEALASADAALVGVVADAEDRSGGGPVMSTADIIVYTVVVEEVLKGDLRAGQAVLVGSERSGASCGLEMAVGERWQMHLRTQGGTLSTGLCAGNELLAEAVPLPAAAGPPAGPPAVPFLVGGAVVVLLAAVSGWAFLRSGRDASD